MLDIISVRALYITPLHELALSKHIEILTILGIIIFQCTVVGAGFKSAHFFRITFKYYYNKCLSHY